MFFYILTHTSSRLFCFVVPENLLPYMAKQRILKLPATEPLFQTCTASTVKWSLKLLHQRDHFRLREMKLLQTGTQDYLWKPPGFNFCFPNAVWRQLFEKIIGDFKWRAQSPKWITKLPKQVRGGYSTIFQGSSWESKDSTFLLHLLHKQSLKFGMYRSFFSNENCTGFLFLSTNNIWVALIVDPFF